MSTGALFITGLAGALAGFFTGQAADERHKFAPQGIAGASLVATVLHGEIYKRSMPQGQRILVQGPLIGFAIGCLVGPRFKAPPPIED